MSQMSMVDMATAVPVKDDFTADVLFSLGIMNSTGSRCTVDLVAAHKWFNLAAQRGCADAIRLRKEIAEQLSREDIARAQHEARVWLTRH